MGEETEMHGGGNCADRQRWVARSEEPAEMTAPVHEESRAKREDTMGGKGKEKSSKYLCRAEAEGDCDEAV